MCYCYVGRLKKPRIIWKTYIEYCSKVDTNMFYFTFSLNYNSVGTVWILQKWLKPILDQFNLSVVWRKFMIVTTEPASAASVGCGKAKAYIAIPVPAWNCVVYKFALLPDLPKRGCCKYDYSLMAKTISLWFCQKGGGRSELEKEIKIN